MAKSELTQVERDAIAIALRIAGPENYSADGECGAVVVEDVFASAIISSQIPNSEARKRFGLNGEPVRISRCTHLEVWCDGFYEEGSGVRGLIHQAARAVLADPQTATN